MTAIAVDPERSTIAYAATEDSGVWKTVDAGSHWAHAPQGLATGESIAPSSAAFVATARGLAVDSQDRRRLLYPTVDDDLGPGQPSTGFGGRGGLYVSRDGAANWRHVTLTGCVAPAITGVALGGGAAYAATRCGVAVSRDARLVRWALIRPNGGSSDQKIRALDARGAVAVACDSANQVFRSADRGCA